MTLSPDAVQYSRHCGTAFAFPVSSFFSDLEFSTLNPASTRCVSYAQCGKTEYKSVTHSPNATPDEFIDFYLHDDSRPTWVRWLGGTVRGGGVVVGGGGGVVAEGDLSTPVGSRPHPAPAPVHTRPHPQDTMIIHNEVLEHGDFAQRQQVWTGCEGAG